MNLAKAYLESEKARFMRHPVFWSVIIVLTLASVVSAVLEERRAEQLFSDALKDAIDSENINAND